MQRNGIGGNGGPPLYGNDSGWVAIARAMRSHPVVGFHIYAKPCDPSRGAMQPALAWIDLIMECRYTSGEVTNNGRKMMLRRGQLLGANLWLAQRWNWTPKATRTWLAKLEDHHMISFGDSADDQQSDQKNDESSVGRPSGADAASKGRSKGRFANVITVCNYGLYQLSTTEERQVEKTFEGRLRAGCGQVEGRLPYIENARAVTKEQDNKGTLEDLDLGVGDAQARERPDEAGSKKPQFTTLCVPQTPPVFQPVATDPVREVDAEFSFRPAYHPHQPQTPSAQQPQAEDGPRDDETEVGSGVFLNCDTVRHRAFTLSIPGIAMQLVIANTGLSKNEATEVARDAAMAHALQWAAEIANGRFVRDVVPSNPANFIRGSVVRQLAQKDAVAAPKTGSGSPRVFVQGGGMGQAQESRTERTMRLATEARETLKAKGVIS